MNSDREFGIHLRLKDDYLSIAQDAKNYGINCFQFFLTKQLNSKYLKIKKDDLENFLKLKKRHFPNIYIHSSFWINPSTGNKKGFQVSESLLKKEIRMAKKLNINYLVLHSGCATRHRATKNDPKCKKSGIQTLANMLNNVLKKENYVQILLENTAHANRSIGSDLSDFALLKEMLKYPAKVNFCLDLSHAFAYGYDLGKKETFIKLLDQNLGIEKIKLIHLNDSTQKQGSKIDNHALPGKGNIGKRILKALVNHKKLKHIPVIVEPPEKENIEYEKIIDQIKEW